MPAAAGSLRHRKVLGCDGMRHRSKMWLIGLPLLLAAASPLAQDAAVGDTSYSRQGADTCLACHVDQQTLGVFKTPHGVPTNPHSPFGIGQLQCEACHGPGGEHTGRVQPGEARPSLIQFGTSSLTPVNEQNGVCIECHSADIDIGWQVGSHNRETIACADCHSSHRIQDSVLSSASQSSVCVNCHTAERSAELKPYGHAQNGKVGCDGCHRIHAADGPSALIRFTTNQTCYQCHAEKRGPFLWEHAPASEDCSLCHAPHGSNHPGALLRRGPFLCQSCHTQSGHPSLANTPDGLANGAPSRFLLGQSCMNCHSQIHGSNHPSGSKLMQ